MLWNLQSNTVVASPTTQPTFNARYPVKGGHSIA